MQKLLAFSVIYFFSLCAFAESCETQMKEAGAGPSETAIICARPNWQSYVDLKNKGYGPATSSLLSDISEVDGPTFVDCYTKNVSPKEKNIEVVYYYGRICK